MWKWKATAAALGVALTIAAFMLHAKSSSLTALDYIQIQQLANRYGQDIDTCSNNGYDYADLYPPDGVFIDKFSPDGFGKGGLILAQGREKLAEEIAIWEMWYASEMPEKGICSKNCCRRSVFVVRRPETEPES